MSFVVPDQTGRRAIVTGANSGIGLETARRLALAGAEVILAVRTPSKGEEAAARIRAGSPAGTVTVEALDLASLSSVAAFANRLAERPIDLLINNAGIMAIPTRQLTVDGFEVQFGTNHLGHFALTGRLLPQLVQATAPRVVTVSSGVAWIGRIAFDNLQADRAYSPWRAYAQSKLANLLMTYELDRLSQQHGWGIQPMSAHPGTTRTNLQATGPNTGKATSGLNAIERFMRLPGIAQDVDQGALPTLYAATSPDAVRGGYYGPDGLFGMTGQPTTAGMPATARDRDTARRLWETSEALTGVRFAARLV